jgi:hypothetical protein
VREGGVEREEGCERRGERGRGSGREKGREGRVEGEEREGGGGCQRTYIFRRLSDPVLLFWYQDFSGATGQIQVFI